MNLGWFKRRWPALLVFVGILSSTQHAFAHSVSKRFGDFYGGMLHPLTGFEHLFPIIGLSLLAGQQGPRASRWMLIAFPIGLLSGATIASFTGPSESVMWANRISFVALGILVATAVRVPLTVLAPLTLLLGLTHGYENTADIPQSVAMHLFLPGICLSGIALPAMVAAVVVAVDRPWQKTAVRVIGSWIAAIGLLIVGLV